MLYKKLGADCSTELMGKVAEVCKIEKRTLSNFIRLAVEEKANEILQKKRRKKMQPKETEIPDQKINSEGNLTV